jgi:bifunctional non-homologous end joining protein LigD
MPKLPNSKEPLVRIKPMLAELVDKPFDDPEWVFEIKFDGYRALANIDSKRNVDLYSRNFISFNERFSPVAQELRNFFHEAILDGEVVVMDKKGVSSFQLLQNYQRTGQGDLKYYVFDILHLDGVSTRNLSLEDRKDLLLTLLSKKKLKNVFYSDHVEKDGKKFFELAKKMNLEGIIAKNLHSKYRPNKRGGDWLKIKITKEQEAVIAGITEPGGGRKHFGSLVLGAYVDNKFEYIGNAGTGFTDAALKELYAKFKSYFSDKSPFDVKVKARTPIQWMKPHFVCQVKFTEWTDDMSMRHPVYMGLREDKKAQEVIPELPKGKKWRKKPASKIIV